VNILLPINKLLNYRIREMAVSLMVLTFLSIYSTASAQSCISGTVLNKENSKPLANVTIQVNGTKNTSTDLNGYFSLCGLSDSAILRIRHIGYKQIEFKTTLKQGNNPLPEFVLTPSTVTMDEVVITATRTDNLILNTPVRVNTFSQLALKSIPMQNIDDVLKYAPGINYSRPFGIFSTKGIVTMRGMSGKEQGRVLVLLDGVPVNKSDGGTVDWNMVDVNSVQKIEITKGAGSAMYGGNAMGGIINIITKTPDSKQFINASIEYGTFNTMGGKISTGGKISRMSTKKQIPILLNRICRKQAYI